MLSSTDLLVVTSAAGKQASALIPLLYGKCSLRLVVYSRTSYDALRKRFPDAGVMRADLTSPTDCRAIVQGSTALLHIGPSFHPQETEIAYSIINAASQEAKHGKFQHFILSSVLNSQLRKMLNHDCKRYEEEYLMESDLNWTILQPSSFMDNFPFAMLVESEAPTWKATWDPDVEFTFCCLRDLAQVMSKVIIEREPHYLAQYPLTSTGPISNRQVASIAGQVLGKEIRIEHLSFEDSVEALLKVLFKGETTGVHPRTRDTAERMLLFYNRRGLKGNSNVMRWLLERSPTTHEEHFQMKLKEM